MPRARSWRLVARQAAGRRTLRSAAKGLMHLFMFVFMVRRSATSVSTLRRWNSPGINPPPVPSYCPRPRWSRSKRETTGAASFTKSRKYHSLIEAFYDARMRIPPRPVIALFMQLFFSSHLTWDFHFWEIVPLFCFAVLWSYGFLNCSSSSRSSDMLTEKYPSGDFCTNGTNKFEQIKGNLKDIWYQAKSWTWPVANGSTKPMDKGLRVCEGDRLAGGGSVSVSCLGNRFRVNLNFLPHRLTRRDNLFVVSDG